MDKITLEAIASENTIELSNVYKEVFRGAPWYEDRICSGAFLDETNLERCTIQYTTKQVSTTEGNLDLEARSGIIGSVDREQTLNCKVCERKLIEFYPEYVDQNKLIEEARSKERFYGMLAKNEGILAGFCWGYAFSEKPTQSVDFPKILPFLRAQEIDPKNTFYWAEVGVVDTYQKQGLGRKLTAALLTQAVRNGYEWFSLRTKNAAVETILKKSFRNPEKVRPVFNDPIRKTPWYLLPLAEVKIGSL